MNGILFIAFLRKELLLEFRSKELMTVMGTLSLLIAVLSAFAVGGAFLDLLTVERVFPLLVWISFLFSATITLGKSHDYELSEGTAEALIVAGAPSGVLYLAKVSVVFGILFLSHILSIVLLAGFIDVPIGSRFLLLVTVSFPIVFAYTLVAVLLSALTAASRLRGVLLPLTLLPLLIPLFLAALELTSAVLSTGLIPWGSPWFGVVTLLLLLYSVAGAALYKTALLD